MNRKQRIANTTTHCRLMLYLFTIEGMPPWQRRMFHEFAFKRRWRP